MKRNATIKATLLAAAITSTTLFVILTHMQNFSDTGALCLMLSVTILCVTGIYIAAIHEKSTQAAIEHSTKTHYSQSDFEAIANIASIISSKYSYMFRKSMLREDADKHVIELAKEYFSTHIEQYRNASDGKSRTLDIHEFVREKERLEKRHEFN